MVQPRLDELEISVEAVAGLVADLDESDDHSLEVVRNIMERVAGDRANPDPVRAHAQAVIEALDAVPPSGGFTTLMTRVARAIDALQDDLRSLKLGILTTETGFLSERGDSGSPSGTPPARPPAASPPGTSGNSGSQASSELPSGALSGASPPAHSGEDTAAPLEVGASAEDIPFGFAVTKSDVLDFAAEADEYVALAESALIQLESDPCDSASLNEAFRCFHNIKGTSGMLGLVKLQGLSHAAESVMGRIREGSLACTGSVSEALLATIDVIREVIRELKDSGSPDAGRRGSTEIDDLARSLEDCLTLHISQSNPHSGPSGPPPSGASASSTGSLPGAGSVPALRSTPAAGGEEPGEPGAPPPGGTPEDEDAPRQRSDDYVRVRLDRLDSLVDLVGELVIADSMMRNRIDAVGLGDAGLAASVSQLSKIMRQLQETALTLRLVPLSGIFSKLSRVARDTSRKQGRDVSASFEGEDTELDRGIVDEISLPLVHMVRNAVDHGIELPEERVSRGKPQTGYLRVSARHEGGSVIISVEDDGHGLDRDKILAKARGLGLIGADEPDDQAVYRCIFRPGFSTADRVTEVSGRGVGLDVVKRAVDNLRGRIDVATEAGKGTRMAMTLPLSMAIIDGMIVSVGRGHYVIPLHATIQVLRPQPGQVITVGGEMELLDVRERLVPLIKLRRLFGLADDRRGSGDSLVVVCSDGHEQCALWVDSLVGEQQVVIKPLGELFRNVPFLSGATVLGNGSVGLILDMGGVIRSCRGEVRHQADAVPQSSAFKHRKRW